MENISSGVLYKKVLNEDGTVKEEVPFLTRTMDSYVYGSDGTTVKDRMDDMSIDISKKIESEPAIDFSNAGTPEYIATVNKLTDELAEVKQKLNEILAIVNNK